MVKICSIDVATKSIAISIVSVDGTGLKIDDYDTYKNIVVKFSCTKDLAPQTLNKNINTLTRIRLVKAFIKDVVMHHIDADTMILIESQIQGTPTYICFVAIVCEFADRDIIVIPPTYKNKLEIGNNKIGAFYRQYTSSYIANKEHSKAMFRDLIKYVSGRDKIQFERKHEADIADTFTQLFAYMHFLHEL
jgi:hypothetical protein